MGDDVELIAARVLGRERTPLWAALLLRLALVALLVVEFVNLVPPLSMWFGEYMGDVFRQSMERSLASPSP